MDCASCNTRPSGLIFLPRRCCALLNSHVQCVATVNMQISLFINYNSFLNLFTSVIGADKNSSDAMQRQLAHYAYPLCGMYCPPTPLLPQFSATHCAFFD